MSGKNGVGEISSVICAKN